MDSRLIFLRSRHFSRKDTVLEGSHLLKVMVAQADVEASAKADCLKVQSRKAPVYTKASVP